MPRWSAEQFADPGERKVCLRSDNSDFSFWESDPSRQPSEALKLKAGS